LESKTPSFSGLKPASEKSSRSKKANKRTETKHEVILRKALWHIGLRYRKNVENMPGKPDIVFSSAKVVVFCDGDFWHGRDWSSLSAKLEKGTNSSYWIAKIKSNIDRDENNTRLLNHIGWCVIRVWESDIYEDSQSIAYQIKTIVQNRKSKVNSIPNERIIISP
jgi:DNA mismatch endonuclease, patch repair protein